MSEPTSDVRIVDSERYPNGVRCCECPTVVPVGDEFVMQFIGMLDGIPVKKSVCLTCGMEDK